MVAKRQVYTKAPKTKNSIRTLAMSEYLISTLKKHREMQNKNKEEFGDRYIITDYVVTSDLRAPINPGYLSNIFTKFVRVYGLKHITLHGLRHTMASVGNEKGLTLYEISKILGHCDTAITSEIYTHVFDTTHAKGLNTIGEAIHG